SSDFCCCLALCFERRISNGSLAEFCNFKEFQISQFRRIPQRANLGFKLRAQILNPNLARRKFAL
ncbi:hypothetical protein, partial [uncultured Campylobacter sp.]|uniref:hypothetical protein n=1 Tax=uncultured Campylobacter sp. TaxID=218934 RepID=UPI00260CAD8C